MSAWVALYGRRLVDDDGRVPGEDSDRALLRSRAERFLAAWARRSVPGLADEFDSEQARRDRRRSFETHLAFFSALGVLDAAAAEQWRDALGAEPWGEGPAVGPEVKRRAAALLEELLGRIEREPGGDAQAWLRGPYGQFAAAGGVCQAVGAVELAELEELNDRAVARLRGVDVDELRHERHARRFTARELDRVLTGPAEREGGLVMLALEIYDDVCLVDWQMPWQREPWTGDRPPPPPPQISLSATDDAGREYLCFWLGGGSRGTSAWRGTHALRPPPPADVGVLQLTLAGEPFTVDLTSQSGQGAIR